MTYQTPKRILDLLHALPVIESPFWIQDDSLRMRGTRVPIDTIVYQYNQNRTPTQIVEDFDVLNLADVYLAIGYYLNHKNKVDEYILERDKEGEALREKWESEHPISSELRARILKKREQNEH